MKRNVLTLPAKAKLKTIEQAAADFTAEGAPPPGKVGTDVPTVRTPKVHTRPVKDRHDTADESSQLTHRQVP